MGLEANGFVSALIDGDGAIFHDYLYKAASDSGADAAQELHNKIRDHVAECYPDRNSSGYDIMVQMFYNMEGLSHKLKSVGIFKNPNEVAPFARAFSLNKSLFSSIDVGSGKERADHKVRGNPTYPLSSRGVAINTAPTPAQAAPSNLPKTTTPNPSDNSSWVTVGKGAPKTINIAAKKAPARKFILLNANDECIDAPLPRADPAATTRLLERVRHKKVCNNYHLKASVMLEDTATMIMANA
ncbi:hypothetical protein QM012_006616 [Aureobasidium pullulans]|uniref:DUF7923 domain-containing protein n=1 Tax=Aureobasidium pullulans TaxID=5580 RepID=A0ABR0TQ28_AURPU